ncbi:MAG: taurine ABC transporter permease TauC [Acuticoccus sp.]
MRLGPRTGDALLGLLGVAIVVAGWELMVRLGAVDAALFPSPSMAFGEAAERLSAVKVAEHTLWSLTRITVGFLLGAVLGTIVGVIAGWYRLAGLVLRPIIELLRPIPPLAWIPLAIIWFGLGEPSKYFIIFLGAFFPVVTAAYVGITSVDPVLIRAAQSYGLKGPGLLLKVGLPAAAPDLLTGLRIGWGLAFGILVAAELIAASRGLGFLIMNERNTTGSVSVIVVGITLIGILNLVTDWAIGAVSQRYIGRWHGR